MPPRSLVRPDCLPARPSARRFAASRSPSRRNRAARWALGVTGRLAPAATGGRADTFLPPIDLAGDRPVGPPALWGPDGRRRDVTETGADPVAEMDCETSAPIRRIVTGDGGAGLAIVR